MNVVIFLSALVLSACGNIGSGYDTVADGSPVYENNRIVRWTVAEEKYSSNVRPGQPYVSCGGRCVEMNR